MILKINSTRGHTGSLLVILIMEAFIKRRSPGKTKSATFVKIQSSGILQLSHWPVVYSKGLVLPRRNGSHLSPLGGNDLS